MTALLLAVSNNPLTPLALLVAFKAVPTASARNWMQASVPAVGQDVTAVRLFDWLAVLPVRSEFGPVSDEVTFGSIADGNTWPVFIGYWAFVWVVTDELRRLWYPAWLTREIR